MEVLKVIIEAMIKDTLTHSFAERWGWKGEVIRDPLPNGESWSQLSRAFRGELAERKAAMKEMLKYIDSVFIGWSLGSVVEKFDTSFDVTREEMLGRIEAAKGHKFPTYDG